MMRSCFTVKAIAASSFYVTLLLFPLVNVIYAQDDLDAVLEGFEEPVERNSRSAEPQSSLPPDEIDLLLEGFEKSSPEEGSSRSGATDLPESELEGEEKPGLPPVFASYLDSSSSWEYYADVVVDLSYSYKQKAPLAGQPDYRGLSNLRFKYQPELKWKISDNWESVISASAFYDFRYKINNDRELYTTSALEEYESEIEVRDAYVRGSSEQADLTMGRQIVVWGKSDNIRVVDILNPLDQREPGIVDIEDLRLPLTMARLDYYFSEWSVTGVAIHEIRFNKLPVYNSEYFPGVTPAPREQVPERDKDNTEYALALSGIFSGWDLSFHWARVFDDRAHLEMVSPGSFVQRHSKISMLGSSFNIALGNWLVKGEIARFEQLKYTNTPGKEYSRLDSLLGTEYSGLTDTILSLEVANRHLLDYSNALEQSPDYIKQDDMQYAFRYTGNFLHNRLEVVLLSSLFGDKGEQGGFTRVSGNYEVLAGLSVTLGVVAYHDGKNPRFKALSDNDRIFLETRYSY